MLRPKWPKRACCGGHHGQQQPAHVGELRPKNLGCSEIKRSDCLIVGIGRGTGKAPRDPTKCSVPPLSTLPPPFPCRPTHTLASASTNSSTHNLPAHISFSNFPQTQADILLVTDGEIPQPSEEILGRLAAAKDSLGLEVHGLLVGRSVTPPMEALCSHLHVFKSWSVVAPGGSGGEV